MRAKSQQNTALLEQLVPHDNHEPSEHAVEHRQGAGHKGLHKSCRVITQVGLNTECKPAYC